MFCPHPSPVWLVLHDGDVVAALKSERPRRHDGRGLVFSTTVTSCPNASRAGPAGSSTKARFLPDGDVVAALKPAPAFLAGLLGDVLHDGDVVAALKHTPRSGTRLWTAAFSTTVTSWPH